MGMLLVLVRVTRRPSGRQVIQMMSQARALTLLFERYQWSEVAVIYYTQRVIVVCLESNEMRRNLMISIAEQGMDTNDYVWLMIETRKLGFGDVWKDTKPIPDGKDALALRAARKFFVIDCEPVNSSAQFVADVEAKMREPPYNCTDCDGIDPTVSQVSELADAMMLYAVALNRSLAAGLSNLTGSELANFSTGQFEGFSGTVIINENSTRDPVFLVYGLNSSNQQIVMLKITERTLESGSLQIEAVQPPSVMWASHGGSPPQNRPPCDYDGSACPPSFVEKYLAITLVAVIVPISLLIVAFLILLRYRKLEEERLNDLCENPVRNFEEKNY
ncbi:Receptor-type guanylate cyclase gcy-22 [Parelaphostrongylus tenuis]|uniref:Receptor-type guanylate cyclase gcy-22 n=1 Tax=Parelaphostrongylus tenuis TaxID=148309 RepID=A0AAD5M3B8_PARTN|nr:Receptor-type guanylate cyclase gcy-22 [Parelaphostrongylus tenuis]